MQDNDIKPIYLQKVHHKYKYGSADHQYRGTIETIEETTESLVHLMAMPNKIKQEKSKKIKFRRLTIPHDHNISLFANNAQHVDSTEGILEHENIASKKTPKYSPAFRGNQYMKPSKLDHILISNARNQFNNHIGNSNVSSDLMRRSNGTKPRQSSGSNNLTETVQKGYRDDIHRIKMSNRNANDDKSGKFLPS